MNDFIRNSSFKREEQEEVILSMRPNLDELTNKFIDAIISNRKFNLFPDMINRYHELIKQLSKEEAIKVISAEDLSVEQKNLVEEAVTHRLGNKNYLIEYSVSGTIMGGLQVYFGDSFLDCSLQTRLNKVQSEIDGLSL